ncbi:TIGR02444 family protein [Alteromonas sp. ZYF713]|nr:TIGR02444 family protein [Alteromonas sp. ZYF713]
MKRCSGWMHRNNWKLPKTPMTSAPELTPELFWQHSLQHYAQPGVADACLALQDNYQVNVNLLLFYHWCYTVNQPVTPALREALEEAVATTDPAIQQHRVRRRAAKGSSDYDALKQQELELEAAQQAELVATYQKIMGSELLIADPMELNNSDPIIAVHRLMRWLNLPQNSATQDLITTVLQA